MTIEKNSPLNLRRWKADRGVVFAYRRRQGTCTCVTVFVHDMSARKQQLMCPRATLKGSGIGHIRCLWMCKCTAELKTELAAILYNVNSNILMISPSSHGPCSGQLSSPPLPPSISTAERWLPHWGTWTIGNKQGWGQGCGKLSGTTFWTQFGNILQS